MTALLVPAFGGTILSRLAYLCLVLLAIVGGVVTTRWLIDLGNLVRVEVVPPDGIGLWAYDALVALCVIVYVTAWVLGAGALLIAVGMGLVLPGRRKQVEDAK